jgi:Domain of unknown function (DUF4203)
MLPNSYQPAAAFVLIIGGAIACFAGYRLFRSVLAIYGFILGALMASSIMGSTNTIGMILGAIVGGIVGAIVLTFAYFVGIALIGAGLGALVAHVSWTQLRPTDPPAAVIISLAIFGAIGAMLLQRYIIVVGTAVIGAWTLLIGILALLADRSPVRSAAGATVWILYPFSPAIDQRWVPFAFIAIGIVGTAVQLSVTGRKRALSA